MTSTKIEWAEKVWNPITGCTKVSPGCANCYAERMSKRLQAMGTRGYNNVVDDKGRWTGMVRLVDQALELPLSWTKPARIFVNSMSDLFHGNLSAVDIDAVWSVMREAYWHDFLILTKRPERMYQTRLGRELLPNVWLGVSVEDQRRADERIPWLLKTPASVRFISAEPLLGPVDLRTYTEPCSYYCDHGEMYPEGHRPERSKLDWVIIGGESGPRARPMHPDWARSLRDQCVASGVPFLFKQWGEYVSFRTWLTLRGDTGTGVWFPGGEDGRPPDMVHVGKKKAGRLLDGQLWDQYPTPH